MLYVALNQQQQQRFMLANNILQNMPSSNQTLDEAFNPTKSKNMSEKIGNTDYTKNLESHLLLPPYDVYLSGVTSTKQNGEQMEEEIELANNTSRNVSKNIVNT